MSPCFSPFSSFYTCFWSTSKSSFCLNCKILCLYLLTFVFLAINLCFNSSITRFILFFFTPYLAFSSLIFLFLFLPVSPCLSLFSLLISPYKLVISLLVLSYHSSFFSIFLSFFTPTTLATQRANAIAVLFVSVTTSILICFITAFTFLVTSLSFLWSTFLKGRYSSVSFLIIKDFNSSMIRCFSCVISVSILTFIFASLDSIGPFPFHILSSKLISWFSSPSQGVKVFLFISSNSSSFSLTFVLMTLT